MFCVAAEIPLKYLSMGCQAPSHFHFLFPFFCFLISCTHREASAQSPPLPPPGTTAPSSPLGAQGGVQPPPPAPALRLGMLAGLQFRLWVFWVLFLFQTQVQNLKKCFFCTCTHLITLSNLLQQGAVKGESVGKVRKRSK